MSVIVLRKAGRVTRNRGGHLAKMLLMKMKNEKKNEDVNNDFNWC